MRSKIVGFIQKNTIIDKFSIAVIKVALIIFPLLVGLCTYDYMSENFCKALFLYAAELTFDMGVRCSKNKKGCEIGGLLFIVVSVMFVISFAMTVLSLVGVFGNVWLLQKFPVNNIKLLIYGGIFLQAVWYTIEALALFICELIQPSLQKSVVQVSRVSDWKYNL